MSIMELGSRIRALRTERQLSQELVAEQLHVSRQAVAKWESGASLPSTANLLALCELLQVEEEETVKDIISKLRMIKGEGQGMLVLDKDMSARTFTPPPAN